jgi:hypothetical protein
VVAAAGTDWMSDVWDRVSDVWDWVSDVSELCFRGFKDFRCGGGLTGANGVVPLTAAEPAAGATADEPSDVFCWIPTQSTTID